jgi:ketosteroid isomerase-like protein
MTAVELFIEAMRRTDAGDHEGFLAMQAPDVEWRAPGTDVRGREQLREAMQPFWQGFSSGRHELRRIAEADGVVSCEGVWHSVNDRELPTPEGVIPATGRTVALRFAIVLAIDVAAGHATSVQLYFDQLEFLGQLGLLPEPAAAA